MSSTCSPSPKPRRTNNDVRSSAYCAVVKFQNTRTARVNRTWSPRLSHITPVPNTRSFLFPGKKIIPTFSQVATRETRHEPVPHQFHGRGSCAVLPEWQSLEQYVMGPETGEEARFAWVCDYGGTDERRQRRLRQTGEEK
ncbi:hypothetical protein BST61_g2592 [Cercospora zeina]